MFQIKGRNITKTHIWIITNIKGKKGKHLPEIATSTGWEEGGEDEEGGCGCDFLWDPITSTYRTRRNPQAPTTIFICMNFFILLLFIKIKKKFVVGVSFFCDWLQRMEDKDQQENIFPVICFLGFGIFFFFFGFGLVWIKVGEIYKKKKTNAQWNHF